MYAAILAAIAQFPSPTVSMVALLALITAADTAQTNAQTKAKGLAAIRTTKVNSLWSAMESLRIYVQGLADALDPASAVALISSAGLLVSTTPKHSKAFLEALFDPTTGIIHIIANASLLIGNTRKKTTFHWQMSTDQKTWTSLTSTPYGNTTLPSPGPGTYWFRVSATVGKTSVAWSQAVSLTIH
jgi:hypothetical protein